MGQRAEEPYQRGGQWKRRANFLKKHVRGQIWCIQHGSTHLVSSRALDVDRHTSRKRARCGWCTRARVFKVRYVVTIRHAELANLAFVDACYSPVPLVLQAYIISSSVHRGTGQESATSVTVTPKRHIFM